MSKIVGLIIFFFFNSISNADSDLHLVRFAVEELNVTLRVDPTLQNLKASARLECAFKGDDLIQGELIKKNLKDLGSLKKVDVVEVDEEGEDAFAYYSLEIPAGTLVKYLPDAVLTSCSYVLSVHCKSSVDGAELEDNILLVTTNKWRRSLHLMSLDELLNSKNIIETLQKKLNTQVLHRKDRMLRLKKSS